MPYLRDCAILVIERVSLDTRTHTDTDMITARVFVATQINFSFAVRDDYFKSVLLFKRNPKRQQPQEHGSAHVCMDGT